MYTPTGLGAVLPVKGGGAADGSEDEGGGSQDRSGAPQVFLNIPENRSGFTCTDFASAVECFARVKADTHNSVEPYAGGFRVDGSLSHAESVAYFDGKGKTMEFETPEERTQRLETAIAVEARGVYGSSQETDVASPVQVRGRGGGVRGGRR